MTLKDFLKLIEEYPGGMPIEYVLSNLMFRGQIDTNTILLSYTDALEKERSLLNNRFNEASLNLTQILCGNFKDSDQEQDVYKRAIHTLNINKFFPPHIYDKQYNYTSEDEKKWDEFCKSVYGTTLKE